MADPIDITHDIVQAETAQSYRAVRQELRDARVRWIDEHEKPVMMEAVDKDGKPVPMPFMVGQIRYGAKELYDPKFADGHESKPNALPEGVTLDKAQEELDGTIRKYFKLEGLDVSPGKPGELAFVSDARRRVSYPAKEEGESDEAYCLRVRDTYAEGPRGAAQAGRPGAGVDGVRRPGGDDSGDGRAAHADGAGDGGHAAAADLDREPGADSVAPAGGKPEPTAAAADEVRRAGDAADPAAASAA